MVFFTLNFFVWGEKSSGAVPFGTMFALLVLWFGISVPLVFLGSYFGYRRKAGELPVRINQIPRQVPEQVWYMQPTFSVIVGGVLPFGAVFIELFFILSSIWLHQFYYVFGFLLLVFIILVSTCAEITIVMCYFQLCAEDYHWWWRSFLTSGSSAGYMFAYSVFYFFTKLEITKFVSALLYFGYMSIAALGFYLCVCIFVWKSSRRSRSTRRESGAGLERERGFLVAAAERVLHRVAQLRRGSRQQRERAQRAQRRHHARRRRAFSAPAALCHGTAPS